MPYAGGVFQIDLDFISHQVQITTSKGAKLDFAIGGKTVAEFYTGLINTLQQAGVDVTIYAVPNEVDPAIPFAQNHAPLWL
jgi:hypothetical protein